MADVAELLGTAFEFIVISATQLPVLVNWLVYNLRKVALFDFLIVCIISVDSSNSNSNSTIVVNIFMNEMITSGNIFPILLDEFIHIVIDSSHVMSYDEIRLGFPFHLLRTNLIDFAYENKV